MDKFWFTMQPILIKKAHLQENRRSNPRPVFRLKKCRVTDPCTIPVSGLRCIFRCMQSNSSRPAGTIHINGHWSPRSQAVFVSCLPFSYDFTIIFTRFANSLTTWLFHSRDRSSLDQLQQNQTPHTLRILTIYTDTTPSSYSHARTQENRVSKSLHM